MRAAQSVGESLRGKEIMLSAGPVEVVLSLAGGAAGKVKGLRLVGTIRTLGSCDDSSG